MRERVWRPSVEIPFYNWSGPEAIESVRAFHRLGSLASGYLEFPDEEKFLACDIVADAAATDICIKGFTYHSIRRPDVNRDTGVFEGIIFLGAEEYMKPVMMGVALDDYLRTINRHLKTLYAPYGETLGFRVQENVNF